MACLFLHTVSSLAPWKRTEITEPRQAQSLGPAAVPTKFSFLIDIHVYHAFAFKALTLFFHSHVHRRA